MKISAGAAMPAHTHGGAELTLVLAGGFSDTAGHYQRGDVTLADSSTNHRPIADADGECLCFAVVDGGIRLSGAFGRIASLMLRL
jgi:putative transcriptional regulator